MKKVKEEWQKKKRSRYKRKRNDVAVNERKSNRENSRERAREREKEIAALTILINPVPDSRSRSNRVHDLQGIYIRSSTLWLQLNPLFIFSYYSRRSQEPLTLSNRSRICDGVPAFATRCTHNPRQSPSSLTIDVFLERTLLSLAPYAFLISSKIKDSVSLWIHWILAQDLVSSYCPSLHGGVSYQW